DDWKVLGDLRAHVGRLLDARAQLVDRARELVALVLDLAADVLGAGVGRHQLFRASVVCLASWIAWRGTGGLPFSKRDFASRASKPTTRKRTTATINRESQRSRKVASPAAAVANRKPIAYRPTTAAPPASTAPIPSAAIFSLISSWASSSSRR